MPHIMIDYSANLEDRINMADFCHIVRMAAIKTGVFPTSGIRVRATRCDHVSIADGDPAHGFIDISVRLRAGRAMEAKKAATKDIFTAAQVFASPLIETASLALSLEMRDIDPELAPKLTTIDRHMKETA